MIINRFIPNADNKTESQFIKILIGMEGLEYGSFDRFLPLKNQSLESIRFVNLTELFEFVITIMLPIQPTLCIHCVLLKTLYI